jgi:potassium efflux system protein
MGKICCYFPVFFIFLHCIFLPKIQCSPALLRLNQLIENQQQEKPSEQNSSLDTLKIIQIELSTQLSENQEYTNTMEELRAIMQSVSSKIQKKKEELEKLRASSLKPSSLKLDASKVSLEKQLIEMESSISYARQELKNLQVKLQTLQTRRIQLPQSISDGAEKNLPPTLLEIQKNLEKLPAEAKSAMNKITDLYDANQKLMQETMKLELVSLEPRMELIQQEILIQEELIHHKNQNILKIREHLQNIQLQKAEESLEKTSSEKKQFENSHPIIVQLVEENQNLAEEISETGTNKENALSIAKESRKVQNLYQEMKGGLETLKNKVSAAGSNNVISLFFQRQKAKIPDLNRYQKMAEQSNERLSSIQLRLLELDEKQHLLERPQIFLREQMVLSTEPLSEKQTALAKEFITTQLELIQTLSRQYNSLFQELTVLSASLVQLVEHGKKLERYIEENILWVRSHQTWRFAELGSFFKGVKSFLKGYKWSSFVRNLFYSVTNNPITTILFSLVLLIQFLVRRRLKNRIFTIGQLIPTGKAKFSSSIEVLFLCMILALLLPCIPLFFSWFAEHALVEHELTTAFSKTCLRLAYLLYVTEFIRTICHPDSLLSVHLKWPEPLLKNIRSLYFMTIPALLITYMGITLSEYLPDLETRASIARLLFTIHLLLFFRLCNKLFHPSKAWLQEIYRAHPKGSLKKFNGLQKFMIYAFPFTVLALSISGYHFAAEQILKRTESAILWLLIIMIIKGLANRQLFYLRRNLAVERNLEKQKENATSHQEEEESFFTLNLSDIRKHSQELVNMISTLLLVTGLYFIFADILPALKIFEKFTLWYDPSLAKPGADISTGAVTLADLILALGATFVTLMAVRNLPGILELTILRRLNLEPAQTYAVTTVFRYLLIVIGTVTAFGAIGVGWSKVQWLAAAFTVGLGFGLQEIFANFISGLILLFEQPIRRGDTVTIGDVNGTVSRIRIRATTITDWNRKELIVPNKDFITEKLINWSLSSNILRLDIPVGVSYKSDMAKVREVLIGVATGHKFVLKDPPPQILMREFADSSVNFEVRIYTDNIDALAYTKDELLDRIFSQFAENGVEIPFPQRDIHIKETSIKAQ